MQMYKKHETNHVKADLVLSAWLENTLAGWERFGPEIGQFYIYVNAVFKLCIYKYILNIIKSCIDCSTVMCLTSWNSSRLILNKYLFNWLLKNIYIN